MGSQGEDSAISNLALVAFLKEAAENFLREKGGRSSPIVDCHNGLRRDRPSRVKCHVFPKTAE